MADLDEFRFEIPAFTPDTMPIDRLMEYVQQVTILLGEPGEVHLLNIERASTQPVFGVSRAASVRVRNRVFEVRAGGGSERRRAAFAHIQRMVEEDGDGPAILKAPEGATILTFEPKERPKDALRGIRQASSVQGTLIRVGGSKESSKVLLEDDAGDTISGCYANRTLAKQLANHLFEPVRLSGIGSWMRSGDGVWSLERMQVQSYLPLEDRPLSAVLRDLQAIPVEWPADTLERLRQLRSAN